MIAVQKVPKTSNLRLIPFTEDWTWFFSKELNIVSALVFSFSFSLKFLFQANFSLYKKLWKNVMFPNKAFLKI